ncbi:uncharacterized protein FOMMEDRAFT_154110 [Fomitiporia mediterranea MF3/22]|uniref:uncharacterized protein n=1 Tax=Fomitiporia mediterranea (strain MF3/22) TaxID=694068 RepID=UPI0004407E92|nr:uncharacterized protein FOMMEDRAFT_154110 [Fomitiporia mediterranea MF3/22]EJD04960.1 hypothetical protein FOMMEDRAFT_154110 [Fomitiporia mediterranea MF3/22]
MAAHTQDNTHIHTLHTRSSAIDVDPSLVPLFVSSINTAKYFEVAILTVLVYNSLITTAKEAKYFWKPKSPISLVYFTIARIRLEDVSPFVSYLLNAAGSPALLCVLGSHLLINLKEAGEMGVNEGTNYRSRVVSNIEFTKCRGLEIQGQERHGEPSPDTQTELPVRLHIDFGAPMAIDEMGSSGWELGPKLRGTVTCIGLTLGIQ